jgi:hypothetical protein
MTASPPYFRPPDDQSSRLLELAKPLVLQFKREWCVPEARGPLGLGPVRSHYFGELAHLLDEEGNFARGLPSPPSVFYIAGLPIYPQVWLTYDAHLTRLLNALGSDWPRIENAMAEAFWRVVPQGFKEIHIRYYGEADPSSIMGNWQFAWTKWDQLNRRWTINGRSFKGYMLAQKAGDLYGLLRETRSPDRDDVFVSEATLRELSLLGFQASVVSWALKRESHFKDFRTFTESPFVTPVMVAASQALWNSTTTTHETNDPGLDAIIERRHAGQVARQFWELVSDLLFHLEIAFGLPDERKLKLPESGLLLPLPVDSRHYANPVPCLTADTARQRYQDAWLSVCDEGNRQYPKFGPWS